MTFTLTSTEHTEDGSVYAHDLEANAGYVNVPPAPASAALGVTEDIGDGIFLDYASDGSLYGIERHGGPVDRWTLMRVVRHLAERP